MNSTFCFSNRTVNFNSSIPTNIRCRLHIHKGGLEDLIHVARLASSGTWINSHGFGYTTPLVAVYRRVQAYRPKLLNQLEAYPEYQHIPTLIKILRKLRKEILITNSLRDTIKKMTPYSVAAILVDGEKSKLMSTFQTLGYRWRYA